MSRSSSTHLDMEEGEEQLLPSRNGESTRPNMHGRKRTNDNKVLAQKLFDCIDNRRKEELEGLCRDMNMLKLTVDKPPAETSLHRAARKGFVDCLEVLLRDIPNQNPDMEVEVPDDEGRTPLLVAVDNAQFEAVEYLLNARHGVDLNARGDDKFGVLHLLVNKLSNPDRENEEEQRRLLKVAKLILSEPHVSKLDLEPHAYEAGLTPLAVATAELLNGNRTEELIELCKNLVTAGASLSETLMEDVLTHIEAMTGARPRQGQSPSRPKAAHVVDIVSMRKEAKDVNAGMEEAEDVKAGMEKLEELLNGMSEEEAQKVVNSRLGSKSLLLHAILSNDRRLIEVLLKFKVSCWNQEATLDLPLHHPAKNGDKDVFMLIVDRMMEEVPTGKLDLGDHTISVFMQCVTGPPNDDRIECFRYLYEKCKLETVQYVATSLNDDDMSENVLSFLKFCQNVMTMKKYDTVLDCMLPITLERAMDGCITLPNPEKDSRLQMNYNFVVQPLPESKRESKRFNELEVPMGWCYSEKHWRAIEHPLVKALLDAKMQKVLQLYIAYVVMYCSLTALFIGLCYNNYTDIAWISMLFIIIVEGFQCWNMWKFSQKFWSIKGIVKVIFMVVMLGLSYIWNNIIVWPIVFAGYDFVMVLGRYPPAYKYTATLQTMITTFLSLIIVFGSLFVAFACSFSLILASSENSNNTDIGNMLVKTLVMSSGELDYSNFSKQLNDISAKLLFVGFLFLIVLVLLNVMNGLAVTDTEEIVRRTEFNKLKVQLETMYAIETFLMWFPKLCCSSALFKTTRTILLSDQLQWCHEENEQKIKLDDNTVRCLREHQIRLMQHGKHSETG